MGVFHSVFFFSCGAGCVFKAMESITMLILNEYGAKGWTRLNCLTVDLNDELL